MRINSKLGNSGGDKFFFKVDVNYSSVGFQKCGMRVTYFLEGKVGVESIVCGWDGRKKLGWDGMLDQDGNHSCIKAIALHIMQCSHVTKSHTVFIA